VGRKISWGNPHRVKKTTQVPRKVTKLARVRLYAGENGKLVYDSSQQRSHDSGDRHNKNVSREFNEGPLYFYIDPTNETIRCYLNAERRTPEQFILVYDEWDTESLDKLLRDFRRKIERELEAGGISVLSDSELNSPQIINNLNDIPRLSQYKKKFDGDINQVLRIHRLVKIGTMSKMDAISVLKTVLLKNNQQSILVSNGDISHLSHLNPDVMIETAQVYKRPRPIKDTKDAIEEQKKDEVCGELGSQLEEIASSIENPEKAISKSLNSNGVYDKVGIRFRSQERAENTLYAITGYAYTFFVLLTAVLLPVSLIYYAVRFPNRILDSVTIYLADISAPAWILVLLPTVSIFVTLSLLSKYRQNSFDIKGYIESLLDDLIEPLPDDVPESTDILSNLRSLKENDLLDSESYANEVESIFRDSGLRIRVSESHSRLNTEVIKKTFGIVAGTIGSLAFVGSVYYVISTQWRFSINALVAVVSMVAVWLLIKTLATTREKVIEKGEYTFNLVSSIDMPYTGKDTSKKDERKRRGPAPKDAPPKTGSGSSIVEELKEELPGVKENETENDVDDDNIETGGTQAGKKTTSDTKDIKEKLEMFRGSATLTVSSEVTVSNEKQVADNQNEVLRNKIDKAIDKKTLKVEQDLDELKSVIEELDHNKIETTEQGIKMFIRHTGTGIVKVHLWNKN
jgi:hypothetical protein